MRRAYTGAFRYRIRAMASDVRLVVYSDYL